MNRNFCDQEIERHQATEFHKELELNIEQWGMATTFNDTTTSYMCNECDDPLYNGKLVYYLPAGSVKMLGSASECDIILGGLGISERLCTFSVSQDSTQVQVAPLNGDDMRDSQGRVLVSKLEKVEEDVHMGSKLQVVQISGPTRVYAQDVLVFGRAHIFRMYIPQEIPDDSRERVDTIDGVNSIARGGYISERIRDRVPENESDAYEELTLYIEDVNDKIGEKDGPKFLSTLKLVCQYIDEANDITREMRSKDMLKFEVEFIWDIYRDIEDVLVIRLMRMPDYEGDNSNRSQVLYYWTYQKFRYRLELMRMLYTAEGKDFFQTHKNFFEDRNANSLGALSCGNVFAKSDREPDNFPDPWCEENFDMIQQD